MAEMDEGTSCEWLEWVRGYEQVKKNASGHKHCNRCAKPRQTTFDIGGKGEQFLNGRVCKETQTVGTVSKTFENRKVCCGHLCPVLYCIYLPPCMYLCR